MLSLIAKKRDIKEGLDKIRKEGEIPAVFYGAGKESTSISVSKIDFKKIWETAGESSAIKISTENGDVDVLIHEVQLDPVKNDPIHVDFLAIDMKKKIRVSVELVFEGISEVVKSGLGTLVKVLYEVEIEALPADLPHNLVVDISKLATLDSQILVSDIKLPPGVAMITKETEVVASIAEQKEEKEEIAEPVDLSAIEVEKKGKKEEEGAPAEAPVTEENK
ncbi:50S ribosomal protein L25 [Patescibacteria group bacterium]|nr:50S ribosomal protein L25 [Patescibacteria group bacterium]MBU1727915.1 50S ribosomal protein L25 [Patescibacteria group bacterium]